MVYLNRIKSLAKLFCPAVQASLAEHQIRLDQATQNEYRRQIEHSYQQHEQKIPFARMKKSGPVRPFTFILLNDHPYLVLHSPAEWKSDPDSHAAPKIIISLITGGVKFLKVYRPESKTDSYPEKACLCDHENHKQWGIETHFTTRQTPSGTKAYLIMDHYGKNLKHCSQNPAVSSRQILGALVQAARSLEMWHAEDKLHLDIKPQNIMYDAKTDVARLIDFVTMMKDKTSIQKRLGTLGYCHPSVETSSLVAGPIEYTKAHDAYSLIVSIMRVLDNVIDRTNHASCKTILELSKTQFVNMAFDDTSDIPGSAKSLDKLPSISAILGSLQHTLAAYDRIVEKRTSAAQCNRL